MFKLRSVYLMPISAEEFLGMSTSAASVRPPLLPLNNEGYLAVIAPAGVDLKPFEYKKGERQGQTGYRMTVKWEILDPEIVAWCKGKNRAPFTSQSIMLNFTSEGALAAENSGLKQLREAVDQNKDGKPWQPAMLIGQRARIMMGHRIDDKGEEQEEVRQVTKA